MTSKRAKSVYHTSLWRAGTLESSRSTPIASPQTGPVLDFSPCRGSSGECSIRTFTFPAIQCPRHSSADEILVSWFRNS
jgi:hypothetical protein